MYSLNMPVSAIRTKVRQEFEKHRYVKQLGAVDVLLFQSHAEFQVSPNWVFADMRRCWVHGYAWPIATVTFSMGLSILILVSTL